MPSLERPDGCRLQYLLQGRPERPPLVLLEGMGGDLHGWRRNVPRLARRCRVVAHDFRGNGESRCPAADWTMTMFVDDTLGLLDHLGIDRAHLYGQSFGGMVAMEIALGHPERVRSLVLAATHGGLDRAVPSEEKAPKGRPWELLYSPGFPDRHPEQVLEDMRGGIEQEADARAAQWRVIQGWSAHDRLGDIAAPTLILHGTADRMIHPENARLLAAGIPGARLHLLEGAGHVYHAEQPEGADGAVLRFVEEVERGS